MSADVLANFTPLDELIQLIYQGIHQFVVLSSVTYDKWSVHVGMVGEEGRWWRGVWTEKEVLDIFGKNASDKLLESFADKLVETIVDGQLYLADFSTEIGAKIKLTFGPTNTRPVSMNLEEMDPAEAASFASNIFLEIAMQAQSRKCRLHPSSFGSSITAMAAPTTTTRSGERISGEARGKIADAQPVISAGTTKHRTAAKPRSEEIKSHDVEMEQEIRHLKEELEKEKQKKRAAEAPQQKMPSKVSRPTKAASLANPNKKARKFQAIEFESDEE